MAAGSILMCNLHVFSTHAERSMTWRFIEVNRNKIASGAVLVNHNVRGDRTLSSGLRDKRSSLTLRERIVATIQ
jgi:hypothetical protein